MLMCELTVKVKRTSLHFCVRAVELRYISTRLRSLGGSVEILEEGLLLENALMHARLCVDSKHSLLGCSSWSELSHNN
jgi:hypothetical protein